MSVVKYTTAYGVTAKTETVHGVAETLADADYLLVESAFSASINVINDGKRGMDPRTGAELLHVRQSGATIQTSDLKVGVRESTVPFSATVEPHDLPRLYRAHGLVGTFDSVTNSWSYQHDVLSSTNQVKSLSMNLFSSDEKWSMRGGVVPKMAIEAKAGGLVVATTTVDGIYVSSTDSAYPDASTYNVSDEVVKFDGMAGASTIGSWSADGVESFKIESDRSSTAIPTGTVAGAHLGFALGAPTVKVSLAVKADALSVFDPQAIRLAATIVPLTIKVGVDAVGRLITYTFPVSQLKDCKRKASGNVTMWDLNFECSGGSDGKQSIVIKHS